MGRPSLQTKQRKRNRQKMNHKLQNPSPSTPKIWEHEQPTPAVETLETDVNCVSIRKDMRDREDIFGEDLDTLEMNVEDCVQKLSLDSEEYTMDYLIECRKRLMTKVDNYRKRLEKAHSKNAEMAYKHRKELETIREFYQSIVHLPTRAGRILKCSLMKTPAAREVLEEAGLNYTYYYDGHKYTVK